eukprot:Rhum_TRINITY_DN6382_c0_g1::Rhum_TRINITY_DN6382_c0_g1_i1::g.19871::m.19871
MRYLVVVDCMTDRSSADSWLSLDTAQAAKRRRAKRLSIVALTAAGEGVQAAAAHADRVAACRSVEEAAMEAGRAVGLLGPTLEGAAVFLVSFEDGEAVVCPDAAAVVDGDSDADQREHWMAPVERLVRGTPGASQGFCDTPPPSLSALIDRMQPSDFLDSKKKRAAGGGGVSSPQRAVKKAGGGGGAALVEMCSRCGQMLWSEGAREAHRQRAVACGVCKRRFCTHKALAVHTEANHPRCAVPGCECNEVFRNHSALTAHEVAVGRPPSIARTWKGGASERCSSRRARSKPQIVAAPAPAPAAPAPAPAAAAVPPASPPVIVSPCAIDRGGGGEADSPPSSAAPSSVGSTSDSPVRPPTPPTAPSIGGGSESSYSEAPNPVCEPDSTEYNSE